MEYSQKSDKVEAHLQTIEEAEAVLESFEADFSIHLV
jgi:hypothetical protein